jgi:hypothetical protein
MMSHTRLTASITALVMAATLAPAASPAHADGKVFPPVRDPLVAKECGACHMAYPAGLLPAASWKALMAGLDSHFGENASLDVETTAKVLAYLEANAASERSKYGASPSSGAVPVLRISQQPWFLRKHGPRRISPASLERRGAKSAADCAACHKAADKTGVFDD